MVDAFYEKCEFVKCKSWYIFDKRKEGLNEVRRV